MKEKIINQPLIFSLIFTAGWFFLYFIFFQSTFETNDDAYMMMFASGFYTGKPMEYILPSGVFLGWILKSLYLFSPTLNWYSYYLIAVHFIAMTTFSYVAIASSKNSSHWLIYIVSILFFESYFLVYLQFTTSAFLIAVAGLLLFVHFLFSNQKYIQSYIIPLAMLLVASQIREKIPLLVLVIGSPLLGYFLLFKGKIKDVILFSTCILVLLISSNWLEDNYKGAIEDWGNHKALFDTGFYPVYNYPVQHSTGNEAIFKSLIWSKNDFDMFKSGFFELLPKYSMENLQILSEYFSNQKQEKVETATVLVHYFIQYKYLTVLTVLVLVSIYFFSSRTFALISLAMTAITVFIWFYIGQDLILKARVIIPMLFLLQIHAIYLLTNSHVTKPTFESPTYKLLMPILLCTLILMGLVKIYWNDKTNVRPSILNYEKQYAWLEQNFPNQVKVVWGTSLSVDHVNVLSNFYSNKKKAQLYLLLANLGYWQNPELLKNYHENDVYLALLHNPRFVLLLADYKLPHLTYLSKFYLENYQLHVHPVKILTYSDPKTKRSDFHVYKIALDESR